ncbi:MAG: dihydroneopterin triphosphate diphosphatase [Candidatus Methylopumilus sp.]|nr:dihydroneopterin triphosphate diphosphatase [Candidatus Methylopumilus sp.]NBW60629.1 dihydroneopterin triphosphate diphosphatase [Methylophilaceae bacterium]
MATAFKTPVSVLVLVYTQQLEVLLIERADKPGFWQSVTGSIESEDADLLATAARELMEETGIDAHQYQLQDWQFSQTYEIYPHWRHRYAPGVTQNVEHVFGLELPGRVPVKLAPREHIAYEWVDWREAAQRVFSWTNVEALRKLGEMHQLSL